MSFIIRHRHKQKSYFSQRRWSQAVLRAKGRKICVFGGGRILPESILGETESLRRWVKSPKRGIYQHSKIVATKMEVLKAQGKLFGRWLRSHPFEIRLFGSGRCQVDEADGMVPRRYGRQHNSCLITKHDFSQCAT